MDHNQVINRFLQLNRTRIERLGKLVTPPQQRFFSLLPFLIHTNIPKGFADTNLDSMGEEVQRTKEIAMASSDDGTVALLRGMKERKDHSEALKRPSPPSLLIWGKGDNYISDFFVQMVFSIISVK